MRHHKLVAVVTGAAQGIGSAIAGKLGNEGARVIIGDIQSPAESFNGRVDYQPLDVADEGSIDNFFEYIEKKYRRLDILVNNAGIMFQKHFIDTSVSDWDRMMAVNLRGVFICSKYAVRLMIEKKCGSIINIGSIEGKASNAEHVPYAASKSALQGLTRAIAVDMGPFGIRCNVVCPGWIETPLNESYFKNVKSRAHADAAMRALHPSGRLGSSDDVAHLVSWLCSSEATWITGQEIVVDGGRLAKLSSIDFKGLEQWYVI